MVLGVHFVVYEGKDFKEALAKDKMFAKAIKLRKKFFVLSEQVESFRCPQL